MPKFSENLLIGKRSFLDGEMSKNDVFQSTLPTSFEDRTFLAKH